MKYLYILCGDFVDLLQIKVNNISSYVARMRSTPVNPVIPELHVVTCGPDGITHFNWAHAAAS
jgi:hypothetical protein